jgi:hypothetical protein
VRALNWEPAGKCFPVRRLCNLPNRDHRFEIVDLVNTIAVGVVSVSLTAMIAADRTRVGVTDTAYR